MFDIDYQIKVMQAFKDGKKIEVTSNNKFNWRETPDPHWNWEQCDYRIKEEPKKKVKMYQGLLQSKDEQNFHVTHTLHKTFEEFKILYQFSQYWTAIKLLPHTEIEIELENE